MPSRSPAAHDLARRADRACHRRHDYVAGGGESGRLAHRFLAHPDDAGTGDERRQEGVPLRGCRFLLPARGHPNDLPGASCGRALLGRNAHLNATYDELTTPSNLTSPLPLRVSWPPAMPSRCGPGLARGGDDRRDRRPARGPGRWRAWRSVLGAAVEIVHRPISTLLTVVVSACDERLAIGLAPVGTRQPSTVPDCPGTRSGHLRPGDSGPGGSVGCGLAVSAVTSAWRSAAFTGEVADALPATSARAGEAPQRSG